MLSLHQHALSVAGKREENLMIRCVNMPREIKQEDVVNMFAGCSDISGKVDLDDVSMIYDPYNHGMFRRECYIHGLPRCDFERIQKLMAEHEIKILPVIQTQRGVNQRETYLYIKAVNIPSTFTEQDLGELFKGWVHQESYIHALYEDENQSQLSSECYIIMTHEKYMQAREKVAESHNINLSVLTNTSRFDRAVLELERFTKEVVVVLTNVPEELSEEDVLEFLGEQFQPTRLRRLDKYWLMTFVKPLDAELVLREIPWPELDEEIQIKYLNTMRKFTIDDDDIGLDDDVEAALEDISPEAVESLLENVSSEELKKITKTTAEDLSVVELKKHSRFLHKSIARETEPFRRKVRNKYRARICKKTGVDDFEDLLEKIDSGDIDDRRRFSALDFIKLGKEKELMMRQKMVGDEELLEEWRESMAEEIEDNLLMNLYTCKVKNMSVEDVNTMLRNVDADVLSEELKQTYWESQKRITKGEAMKSFSKQKFGFDYWRQNKRELRKYNGDFL